MYKMDEVDFFNVMSHHFLFLRYIHFIFNSEHYLCVCIFKTQLAWIISRIVRIKCRWDEGYDILLRCKGWIDCLDPYWVSVTVVFNRNHQYFLSILPLSLVLLPKNWVFAFSPSICIDLLIFVQCLASKYGKFCVAYPRNKEVSFSFVSNLIWVLVIHLFI